MAKGIRKQYNILDTQSPLYDLQYTFDACMKKYDFSVSCNVLESRRIYLLWERTRHNKEGKIKWHPRKVQIANEGKFK